MPTIQRRSVSRLSRPGGGTLPLLAAVAALVIGCDRKPTADATPAATAEAVSAQPGAAPDSSPRLATARALAMAKPSSDTSADRDIERYQKTAQGNPEKIDAWIILGRTWVRKAREAADPGYYLNANACADLVLDMEPQNRMALDLRGLVLLNDHKFAEARDLAEQLLVKEADDLLALATLSDALLELGRFEEAAAAAQKLNDLKPSLPSYSRASHLRWLQGDAAAAKAIARQAIDARDPKDPEPGAWVTVQAAMLFWHEGNYSEADKGFDMALQAVRDYPPALVGKGRIALAKGDAKGAEASFAKAYKQSPLVETAWLLGDARATAGDAKGADEAYALVVKHGRLSDGRTLALFYATKDREHDEARSLAEAERKIRDDIYTEDACAWALYRAGKLPEARAASDKALALGTKDARLLYHAGAIRIAAGDKAGGEKLVKEALEQNPGFDPTGAAEAAKLVGHDATSGG